MSQASSDIPKKSKQEMQSEYLRQRQKKNEETFDKYRTAMVQAAYSNNPVEGFGYHTEL